MSLVTLPAPLALGLLVPPVLHAKILQSSYKMDLAWHNVHPVIFKKESISALIRAVLPDIILIIIAAFHVALPVKLVPELPIINARAVIINMF